MKQESGSPFDSIENAHDFVTLLSEVVCDTKKDIDADIERQTNGKKTRRLDALRMASYNLEKLELHMAKSSRILNDLRSLRRLLFEERKGAGAPAAATKPIQPTPLIPVPKPEVPVTPMVATAASQLNTVAA